MITKEKLIELASKRLSSFGYGTLEEDSFSLNFLTEKVIWDIKNNINQKEVPEGLKYEAVDMICGEFLNEKYSLGNFDIEAIDLGPIVNKIQEGDTSVSFAVGQGAFTPEERLVRAINYLRNFERRNFASYRRLKW